MPPQEKILNLHNVSKTFSTSNGPLNILENISLSVFKGEKVAIIGPSGSGKSTLLSLIGLLDTQTSGIIEIAGVDVQSLSEKEQARFRNQNIGFIFQSFELIAPFNAEENIKAPVEIGGNKVDAAELADLIARLGLLNRKESMPNTLSGGEKQRVAIGRALMNRPAILLADEPTGSLDRTTGEKVISLLVEAVEKTDTTLLVITHDESIADKMDRVFEIKDKTIYERT